MSFKSSRIALHPYLGFGTEDALHLKGRVLRGDPIVATAGDSVWRNLRNMIRRLESDEVGNARVSGRHAGLTQVAISDDEGYFELHFDLAHHTGAADPATAAETAAPGGGGAPIAAHGSAPSRGQPGPGEPVGPIRPAGRRRTGWAQVQLELLTPLPGGDLPAPRATGQVLVPYGARFGVISDLDDTVIRSEITDTLKMLRIALTSNPHTRLPFDGVADFYQALERGPGGDDGNPIFYVSSSPWNLHDLLVQFMTAHGVPIGPLLLRDWSPRTVRGGGQRHKAGAIATILETYPDLRVVLIGDSGEHDPEIYAEIVRSHPGRALAVYIRDVTAAARHREVLAIGEELRDLGTELVLTAETAVAAAHARRHGLVTG